MKVKILENHNNFREEDIFGLTIEHIDLQTCVMDVVLRTDKNKYEFCDNWNEKVKFHCLHLSFKLIEKIKQEVIEKLKDRGFIITEKE